MSVDNIIARIMADTEAQAAETKAQAEERALDLKEKLLLQARQKAGEIAKQADLDIEEIDRRQSLIAELENRKSILAVRRQVLDQTFELAEKKLLELPEDKWETLLTRCIMDACETGEEKLCVPEQDKGKYHNYFLEKLNNELKAQGKAGNLSLADKSASFSGGVLVIGKDGDYDASFASILKSVRAEFEKQAADMLFDAEV